jgi:P27 family predicted phage terminase small subunit
MKHAPPPGREPQPPALPPDLPEPAELTGDPKAIAEWRRLVPMLTELGVATESDRAALIAICLEWSKYVRANAEAARLGMIVKAPSGFPITNPFFPIANRALAALTKLWAELGLTPSSRARVSTVESASPNDVFAEFDDPLPRRAGPH